MEFKRIVLTTDLSDNADAAIPVAVELARLYAGTIHLLHVCEESPFIGDIPEVSMADASIWFASLLKDREEKTRAKAADLAKAAKGAVVAHIVRGDSAREILKFAQEQKADCIVIATHGRSGFARLFLGSVAEKVIRGSTCPVVSVRSKG